MIWNILVWSVVAYIGIIILWRLFVAIMIIIEGYKNGGIKQGLVAVLVALGLNLLTILGDIWGFIKWVLVGLVILFIIRACS